MTARISLPAALKVVACVALMFALLVSACARNPHGSKKLEAIDAIVTAEMREQGVPGVSVVILEGDQVLLSKGYGAEDLERPGDIPTGDTVYMLNSNTKQFLAALVLRLAEQGKLSLDDPVRKYLPEYTKLPADLQLRRLLNHTAGVREDAIGQAMDAVFSDPKNLESVDSAYAAYRRGLLPVSVGFTPGSRWSYSNTNYVLLTLVVERVLGKPYDEALAESLFKPLGLTSLRQCVQPQTLQPRGNARGYIRNREGAGVVPHEPERFELIRGEGGLCGSTGDLARWTRMLATGKAVTAASYSQMVVPARLAGGGTAEYGYALSLVRPDGVARVGHGGYGSGYSAQVAYYPDAGFTIAVAFNRWAFPEYVERRVARLLLGLPDPPVAEVELPTTEATRYAGSYDVGISGWMPVVASREKRLWLELGNMPPMPLAYLGGGEFVVAGEPDGYRLGFQRGAGTGDAAQMRLQGMGLMAWYGVKR